MTKRNRIRFSSYTFIANSSAIFNSGYRTRTNCHSIFSITSS